MSVQSVNPFSNFKTNFNNTNTAAVNTTTNTASDTVQNAENAAKGMGKKTAVIGGIAALAMLGIGAAVAIKRHKVPDDIKAVLKDCEATNEAMDSLSQSIQKQADEVIEYAQKVFDEITELFKKGDEITPDGKTLRKITSNGSERIMEEFGQDGTIARRSTFVNEIPKKIQEGYEELADGSWKYAKELTFENGKPNLYIEGFEKLADGTSKYAKELTFVNGKPFWYKEGYEELADGTSKYAKELTFENGKPNLYKEGAKYNALKTDEPEEVGKQYALTKKGWQEVTE